ATLHANLEAHASVRDLVEFLIVVFGDSRDTIAWIKAEFASFMCDDFLRVEIDHSLDTWHFGKAKNSFRHRLRGRFYSSLDGDNFVTMDETQGVLDIARTTNGYFLGHHFSGQWGDGTCGRLTLPAEAYWAVGYNSSLLPRQYDEMDMILASLK